MILNEMTMTEFSEYLTETRTLILPYGTVEAHGGHLPLNTDTLIMERVAARAAEEAPAFVAPPIHYGVCTSTGEHPGSIGITPETLRRVTMDIVKDGAGRGLKNFILISGHGGGIHVSAMREAGEVLTAEMDGINVAPCSIYDILPRDAFSMIETERDSHAGEGETSLVMHLAPDLVKGTSPEEYPEIPKPIQVREKVRYWPGAVWGDPGKGTEAKGRELFEVMVESLAALIRKMEGL